MKIASHIFAVLSGGVAELVEEDGHAHVEHRVGHDDLIHTHTHKHARTHARVHARTHDARTLTNTRHARTHTCTHTRTHTHAAQAGSDSLQLGPGIDCHGV